jgi:hypothetical protein
MGCDVGERFEQCLSFHCVSFLVVKKCARGP